MYLSFVGLGDMILSLSLEPSLMLGVFQLLLTHSRPKHEQRCASYTGKLTHQCLTAQKHGLLFF
jgi:hypothetical protein